MEQLTMIPRPPGIRPMSDLTTQFCIEKCAMPQGWRIYAFDSGEKGSADFEVKGRVCADFQFGERAGHPNWKDFDPATEYTLRIGNQELIDWMLAREAETGVCADCDGTGQSWAGWDKDAGHKYRECRRCSGTGKSPARPREIEKALRKAGEEGGE